jgi:hypothetical protein
MGEEPASLWTCTGSGIQSRHRNGNIGKVVLVP